MIIIPAIDLIDGQVVRLHQGDFNQKTEYQHTIVELLQKYQSEGAERIHLVDLQGAKSSELRQWNIIKELIQNIKCPLQLGGGVRCFDDAKTLYEMGIDQVIIGSLAVKNTSETTKILKHYPSTILSADLIEDNGKMYVASEAWTEKSDITLKAFIESYPDVQYILSTDISRDGTMTSPNFELYQKMQSDFPDINFIASGGVSQINDLKMLKSLNLYGVVVGKALLDGVIDFSEALSC